MRKPALDVRSILFGFLMLVLCLPALNLYLPFVESGKLAGDVRNAPDTAFTPESWFAGRYQQKKDHFFNDQIGFRPDLVRINNQIDYFLFRKLHAGGVVLGKDQYLYEAGYINAYNGEEYLGHERILNQLSKLRYIQDTLARAGKPLVMAFIPSKGRYFPEYFPEKMQAPRTRLTNYEVMQAMCDSLGINNIDLNGWFRSIKARAPHPLFSKQGIHWTRLGAELAADTLNRYLETLLHIDILDMHIEKVECTPEPRGDNDIAQGLNLIWPITTETLCYNHIRYDEDSATKTKPSVIFISDSFFWTFIGQGIPHHCYKDWGMWYYFREIWDESTGPLKMIETTDWMKIIDTSDALVLFFTEPNLPNLGYGFIDQAFIKFGGKNRSLPKPVTR